MDSLYIRIRDEVLGPLDRDAALAVFRERKLTPSHQVSHDGNDWFPASRVWEQLHAGPAAPPIHAVSAATTHESKPRPTSLRRPPPAITSAPPPPTRSRRQTPTPSEMRPPSVELSADAKTPTADEIELSPVRAGFVQSLLSVLLVTAIAAHLVGAAIGLHFCIRAWELYGNLAGGTLLRVELEERVGDLGPALNQATFGVFLGTLTVFILYCFWIFHTDGVLQRRRLRRLRFTRWWCVGWEFVPVCNLWFPYQILAEVWHGSAARTKLNWRGSMPLPIALYWIVKIISAAALPVVGYFAYSAAAFVDDVRTTADVTTLIERRTTYLSCLLGYSIVGILCYVLLLVIVLLISWRVRIVVPASTANSNAATAT